MQYFRHHRVFLVFGRLVVPIKAWIILQSLKVPHYEKFSICRKILVVRGNLHLARKFPSSSIKSGRSYLESYREFMSSVSSVLWLAWLAVVVLWHFHCFSYSFAHENRNERNIRMKTDKSSVWHKLSICLNTYLTCALYLRNCLCG